MTDLVGGSLKMTEEGVRDAEKLANVIRKLVADWWEMRTALELISCDPGAERANREHAARIVGRLDA